MTYGNRISIRLPGNLCTHEGLFWVHMALFSSAILYQSCEKLNGIALKYMPYNHIRVTCKLNPHAGQSQ